MKYMRPILIIIIAFTAFCVVVSCSKESSNDAGVDSGFSDGGMDASDRFMALAMKVSAGEYVKSLEAISIPREPGSENWKKVQDFGAARFAELGYAVERQSFDGGVNVIGVKQGLVPDAGEIVVSAHYDSVPGCESADDNASGSAGVLEAARALSGASFDRTLVVALWDHEEGDRYTGVLGSKAYAARARERGERIEAVFVFEMIGYSSSEQGSQEIPPGLDLLFPTQVGWLNKHNRVGDFVALVSDEKCREGMQLTRGNADTLGLPTMVLELKEEDIGNVAYMSLMRSDHSPFWKQGYPAMMVTDTSEYRNRNYHCPGGTVDSVGRLNPDYAVSIVRAVTATTARMLGLRD